MNKREFEDTIESAHPGKYFFLTVDYHNRDYNCFSMTYAYRAVQFEARRIQILPPISYQRLYMADYALADDKVLKARDDIFGDKNERRIW